MRALFCKITLFIFFCLDFSGLFRCDSFYFFITPDEIAAVRIADFSGNKRNIVTGKKQHVFCRIDSGCRNIFFAGHIVAAVKIHGKCGVRHVAHGGKFLYGQFFKIMGINVFGNQVKTDFVGRMHAGRRKRSPAFLPVPYKTADDFPKIRCKNHGIAKLFIPVFLKNIRKKRKKVHFPYLLRRKNTGAAERVDAVQNRTQIQLIRLAGGQKIGVKFNHIILHRNRPLCKRDGMNAFGRKKDHRSFRSDGCHIIKGNLNFSFQNVEKLYIIVPVSRNRKGVPRAVKKKSLIRRGDGVDIFI